MNTGYLNTLPALANKYNVDLQEGEKVVFTAKLSTFGTEKDYRLGADDSKFTLTNRRIIADNGYGVWSVDILDDVVSCTKIKSMLIFTYFQVMLNKTVVFDDGSLSLTGFNFYFKKSDTAKFESIMNSL